MWNDSELGRKILRCSFALLAAAAVSACTSEVVKPAAQTVLMVTRAGETVNMQWQSLSGATYTVIYADQMGSGAQWKPLPQGLRLPGTGGLMQLKDTPPSAHPRYYDLQIEYPK